jgi:hypothetical protein
MTTAPTPHTFTDDDLYDRTLRNGHTVRCVKPGRSWILEPRVRQLAALKLPDRMIAAQLETDYGIHMTPSKVQNLRDRYGIPAGAPKGNPTAARRQQMTEIEIPPLDTGATPDLETAVRIVADNIHQLSTDARQTLFIALRKAA